MICLCSSDIFSTYCTHCNLFMNFWMFHIFLRKGGIVICPWLYLLIRFLIIWSMYVYIIYSIPYSHYMIYIALQHYVEKAIGTSCIVFLVFTTFENWSQDLNHWVHSRFFYSPFVPRHLHGGLLPSVVLVFVVYIIY